MGSIRAWVAWAHKILASVEKLACVKYNMLPFLFVSVTVSATYMYSFLKLVCIPYVHFVLAWALYTDLNPV